MIETIHTFENGVRKDVAPQRQDGQHLTGLNNMRLLEVDGKGLVLVSIDGNENTFSLTPGFAPLGHVVYNGIAYIFSFDPSKDETEVGTYPSPLDGCGGGFEHVYKPLNNWNGTQDPETGIAREPFRTTLFNHRCDAQLEVKARISWDDSLELFFVDGINPIRHINTGFHHRTGVCNDRMFWTGSFPNKVNVFFETCGHPIRTGLQLLPGGELQAGNFYFYGRYATADLNKTSFLFEIGPIQVTQDDLSTGITLDGDAGLVVTNKSVEFTLVNFDTSYPYMEFGFVYYHDTTQEVRLIDKRFDIPQSGPMTVLITGTETIVDLTLAELIRKKNSADVALTIDIVNNCLAGGNWSEQVLPLNDMRALAQQLIIKPADPGQMPFIEDAQPGMGVGVNGTEPYQYKDYRNTLDLVGHFRGETYPFAMVFVFKNGKRSRPIVMRGYDAWMDPGITQPNTKGILRMPSNMNAGYAYYQRFQNGDWRPKPLGVRIDNTGIALPQWAVDNVCGFYVVRGERKANLVYQTMVANTYDAQSLQLDQPPLFEFPASGLDLSTFNIGDRSSNRIPEFWFRSEDLQGRAAIPYETSIPEFGGSEIYLGRMYPARVAAKFGLFSSDHFFQQNLLNGQYTIVHQGYAGNPVGEPDGLQRMGERHMSNSNRFPDYLWDQQRFTPRNDLLVGKGEMTNVAPRTWQATAGFVSGYDWGNDTTTGGPVFLYLFSNDGIELGNRRMGQRNYIGCSFTEGGTVAIPIADDNTDSPIGPSIVNIYRNDPRTALAGGTYDPAALYDPAQTTYYEISPFIPVSDWADLPNRIFYRGDCFLQRTYHRHLNEMGFHGVDETANNRFYNYGNMVGMVQECAVNTAMRYEQGSSDGDQRYYPEKLPNDPQQFASILNNIDESRLRNAGYDRILSILGYLGDDPLLPAYGTRHPNRIRHSQPYLNDALADGFLKWDEDSYRDYDHQYGPIQRIVTMGSSLLSVQERSLSFLPISQEAVLPMEASQGQLLIGRAGFLPEKETMIKERVGTQHRWSVIRSDIATYGYDQEQRMIWRVVSGQFQDLSAQKFFRSDLMDVSELSSDHSDILHRYPDAPVCDQGVVAFHDAKFHEVGWTFSIRRNNGSVPEPITIVYNERLDTYLDRRDYNSPYYLLLNEDFFSVRPQGMPAYNPVGGASTSFWLHDRLPQATATFHGLQRNGQAQVDARPELGPHVFDTFWIKGTGVNLELVRFSTEFGQSSINFSTAPHWHEPKFLENRWKMPVPSFQSVNGIGQEYGLGAPVRGGYLRSLMQWLTNDRYEVHATFTHSRPSKQ